MIAGPGFPPLHLITDDRTLARPGFVPQAAAALEAGKSRVALHLRARGTPAALLFRLARELAPRARDTGAWLVINDRVDVALAAGAAGVQLGGRGMTVADARHLLGPLRPIGASVHSAEEAWAAARQHASFAVVGTLFATASHPGRAGRGTEWLTELATLPIPWIGIGGVTVERVGAVLAAGGRGVAVLRGVWESDDAARAARRYLQAMERQID